MKLKSPLVIAFVISAVCIICFSLLSLLISEHMILHFDSEVISAIQGWESPSLTCIMKFFTFIGGIPFVIGLFFLCFIYKVVNHRMELILFISTLIGASCLNVLLKKLFHRVRPNLHPLIDEGGYSFPSGHAMNAFTVYAMIVFILWRHVPRKRGRSLLILFSFFMILGIGISRIYLGVHYPSDIIGGYLASGFWLTTAIWIFRFYQKKTNKSVDKTDIYSV
ncbi:phosphatase PAP2 family protein [Neobacillus sp. PS2-9]|uniref:phosphatase PAP2 family protein n=1 Tax=Neobacillus sp. PS2-9 TaxID=3070676 RepID=UPI0027E1D183|nr:phosphatase PAP2 family protein [Neobacillus sp. PS2-9]WML56625.1 phosphatase PAP2 family protein [Neobacillus sp. PS2-9]